MITKQDLTYIAGLIDAEGCLRIVPKKIGKKIKYKPTITIGMCDRWILEWVVSLFPATIHCVPARDVRHKDFYVIKYQPIKTEYILSLVYPYLRVKRQQADLLIKALKIKQSYKQGSHAPNAQEYIPLVNCCTQLKKIHACDYVELPTIFLLPREEELSYLAGLIDGDGCIVNCKIPRTRSNHTYLITHHRLSIQMNQPEGMISLMMLFGGNVLRKRKNTVFYWQIGGCLLDKALEALIPYLKLKKEQATQLFEERRASKTK